VLVSVLLGSDPPWLPTGLLVRTAELFGITEGATRTALSRMVAAGEANGEDGGYRLAGRLIERQRRQTTSRRADVRPWDGTWEVVTVEGDGRRTAVDRASLRDAVRALRLAEVREGVWTRPDNLPADRLPDAASVVDHWCVWWRGARPSPVPATQSLWDLAGWASEADRLRADMAALIGRLEDGATEALAKGFVTSAAVLRQLQADPLLPSELLPGTWPGAVLRADYDRYDAAYRSTLRAWFRAAS